MGPRFCKRGNGDPVWHRQLQLLASMGPRFCKRGNTGVPVKNSQRLALLQWGHAFVSVETAGIDSDL